MIGLIFGEIKLVSYWKNSNKHQVESEAVVGSEGWSWHVRQQTYVKPCKRQPPIVPSLGFFLRNNSLLLLRRQYCVSNLLKLIFYAPTAKGHRSHATSRVAQCRTGPSYAS